MNEKLKKAGVIGTFILLVGLLVVQSIVDHQTIRRANSKVDQYSRLLTDSRMRVDYCAEQLVDCRRTITECDNSVERIANELNESGTTLQSVIANLRTVREEVEAMENALDYFHSKYGYNLDNSNIFGDF